MGLKAGEGAGGWQQTKPRSQEANWHPLPPLKNNFALQPRGSQKDLFLKQSISG